MRASHTAASTASKCSLDLPWPCDPCHTAHATRCRMDITSWDETAAPEIENSNLIRAGLARNSGSFFTLVFHGYLKRRASNCDVWRSAKAQRWSQAERITSNSQSETKKKEAWYSANAECQNQKHSNGSRAPQPLLSSTWCVHCDVTRVLSLYKAGCRSQVCSKNPWVHDFPMTWPNNLKVNMGRSW